MADKPLPPHLMLTRPRAASERFIAALVAKRVPIGDVVISPAISIETLGGPFDVTGYDGIIATSPNALVGARGKPGVTAWCVGDATAEAARRAGFDAVSANGNADDLVRLVVTRRPKAPLLHLRGQHAAGDLKSRLRAFGIDVEERVVYDQPESGPTERAAELLAGERATVLPLFSPRSAAIVADWAAGARAPLHAVAMSEAVAQAWGRPARLALRPNFDAMVSASVAELTGLGNG